MQDRFATPSIEVLELSDTLVARFVGLTSLTEENMMLLEQQFESLVSERPNPKVTLDLAAIDYLTSMVVGKILGLHRRLKARDGRLTIVNMKPFVRQVFQVAKLDRVLHMPIVSKQLSA